MKKKHYFYQAMSCLVAISLTSVSCNDDNGKPDTPAKGDDNPKEETLTIPTIKTVEVTEISDKSAISGGIISDNGGGDIMQKGVVWDIEKNPTTELPTLTKDGVGNESFTSKMENLKAGTTYYYRAYATNSAGTAYGEELSFTTGEPPLITVKVDNLTMDFILVEGGTFQMGATPEHEGYAKDYEYPVHPVTLDSYYIGKYEVTQAIWIAVMGNNPSMFKGDNKSVENLSWDLANQFVQKLCEKTGLKFALPTEAQWEYAARGGKHSHNYLYSGSDDASEIGWFNPDKVTGAQEVGQKKPNELGIYDMCGNVWEWCQDWYGPYTEEAQTNPIGAENSTDKVMRGGSWICVPEDMGRVSRRLKDYPQVPRMDNGVRLVYIP